jgi:prepilin-type N-terminal cleavage/methylation domain-containing protein
MNTRGFTLMETIVAAGILAIATAGIASLFTSSIRTNLRNRQQFTADILLAEKIEYLGGISLSNPEWNPGAYSDSVTTESGTYRRFWQISGSPVRTLTVTVFVDTSARQIELTRASTTVSPSW